jgi:hypothetical protein
MYNQHIFFHHITSTCISSSLVTMKMYTVHSSEVEHTKHNIGPENVLCGFFRLVPPLQALFVVSDVPVSSA